MSCLLLFGWMAADGSAEARKLEVRCGIKNKEQTRKVYVHMLNGTLCATERALCCLVENYQTSEVGDAAARWTRD